MRVRANSFELLLLTTSKDVELRRLRGYVATMGGSAQIVATADALMQIISEVQGGKKDAQPARRIVVVADGTIPLRPSETQELRSLVRYFLVDAGPRRDRGRTPGCWQLDGYVQCALGAFLESAIVRLTMTYLTRDLRRAAWTESDPDQRGEPPPDQPFQSRDLLRWGHVLAMRSSRPGSSSGRAGDLVSLALGEADITAASLAFSRSLKLTGEGRRLTAMFGHFASTRLRPLKLLASEVAFGADGLVTMASVRATPRPGFDLALLADELGVHDFQVAIVNSLPSGMVEIAALLDSRASLHLARERIIIGIRHPAGAKMPIGKPVSTAEDAKSENALPVIEKAG